MTRLYPARLALPVLKRRLTAALLLLVAMLLAACSSSPEPVLTGTVKDAYTGQPVRAASVQIGETTVTTDANGVFTTPSWSKTDTLAVTAPNYEPVALPLEAQPQIAKSDTLTITLDTALRPNTLRGVVRDEFTGEPVAGASLSVTVDISNTLGASTDATGAYSIDGVPEQFDISISAPDYAPVQSSISRTTGMDLSLRPNVLSGVISDRFSNKPVAGATVQVGTTSATTDAQGRYKVVGLADGNATVEVSATGYASLSQELGRGTSLDAILRPDTLQGKLIDKASGEPIANATIIATATLPGSDVAFTRIDDSTDGAFTLKGLPEQGFLQILSPGYAKQVIEIKPGNLPSEIALDRFVVRALYITAAVASTPTAVEEYVDLIEKSELNAIVVDLKSDLRDDLGRVYYDTQVPLAKELGLSSDYIDMPALVQELKSRGIYTIARIQLFSHDNALSDARPDWSIKLKETGEVYADYPAGRDGGIRYAYLDPTNKNVWEYNTQLGVEAALMGFDEINYDYIRFPDWYGDRPGFRDTLQFSEPMDPVDNPKRMFEVLAEFMDQAHRAINGAGAKMSVDVFGRVVLGGSLTIAQDMQLMGAYTDYICPMPYPSLWWPGAFDIESPVEEPFAVLDAATKAGVAEMVGQYARMRPWLQDHTDPWAYKVVKYGPVEVRAQIDATEQYPEADGWMLYDSANAYRGAFNGAVKPEK